jgi:membrane protease YdiL (CAAX protease family)
LLFFATLASLLVPLLILARQNGSDVSVSQQAAVVAAASCICQLLRRRPLSELLGRFDLHWPRQLLFGIVVGAAIMLLPGLFLRSFGYVRWQNGGATLDMFLSGLALSAGVAIAEELLFRGFIFQRLIDGLGEWPAQLILGGYFVLTHSAGLSAAGNAKYLASVNIFVASLAFGLAFVRTRSLAMPTGIHFAANATQGDILGFGVSGNHSSGLLRPVFADAPEWLTGGAFGLEASVPGLISIAAAVVVLYRWRARTTLTPAAGLSNVE